MQPVMMSIEEIYSFYNSKKDLLSGRVCVRCGSKTRMTRETPFKIRCTWKKCNLHFSIWKGTIFENVKMDHMLMLKIINLWSINATPLLIAKVLRCKKESVTSVLKKLKEKRIYTKYLKDFSVLGTKNVIVEIDETKIGKNKYHRGHIVKGFWAFGAVERTFLRKIIIFITRKRNSNSLLPLINRFIHKEAIIHSDMWKVYYKLKNTYKHFMVNHSKTFVDKLTGIHTNTIEGNWRSLKESIPIRCRTYSLAPLYVVRYMISRNEKGLCIVNLLKYCF